MLRKSVVTLMILALAAVAYSQSDSDGKENFAFLKTANEELRTLPKATAPAVFTLQQFDLLLPTDLSQKKDWVKVITLDGKEGWLPITSVGLITEQMPALKKLTENIDPMVRLVNNTNLPITLNIAGTIHKLPARKQKILRFKPGSYPYTLRLPGFTNGTGTRYFLSGGAYTWSFKIVTKTVKRGR